MSLAILVGTLKITDLTQQEGAKLEDIVLWGHLEVEFYRQTGLEKNV